MLIVIIGSLIDYVYRGQLEQLPAYKNKNKKNAVYISCKRRAIRHYLAANKARPTETLSRKKSIKA
jgi:hypothetical protein